ncbi:MAG: hypothetical protein HVN35_03390 [Methanobacteriaceae archaeon]|nr:hypothetical protein [Methanobacteriaceae archaeon]
METLMMGDMKVLEALPLSQLKLRMKLYSAGWIRSFCIRQGLRRLRMALS